MPPTVSIITGHVERHQDLARLIDSIVKNTHIPWELIVVDASENLFVTDDIHVHILPDYPPKNMSASYNRGIALAQGRWVLWLNDDAVVTPYCIDNAVAFMERHSAIVGLGALYWRDVAITPPVFRVDYYWGLPYANFGILEKSFGDSVGWFDVEFPMYGNDNSLAFRVLHAGKGVVGIGNAIVLHYRTQDAVRVRNDARKEDSNKTALRLKTKYVDNGGLAKMTQAQLRVTHLAGPGEIIL